MCLAIPACAPNHGILHAKATSRTEVDLDLSVRSRKEDPGRAPAQESPPTAAPGCPSVPVLWPGSVPGPEALLLYLYHRPQTLLSAELNFPDSSFFMALWTEGVFN